VEEVIKQTRIRKADGENITAQNLPYTEGRK
jgi:hypothetical protein